MKAMLLLFGAGFASVFLLGFQSRNVNAGHYGWAASTSVLIAVAQASVIVRLARSTWLETGVYAVAGVAGIVSSMWIHERFIARGRP